MSLLFGVAAAVQWNDPDPLLWVAPYCATALFAGLHAKGRRVTPPGPALLGLLLAAWALSLTPSVLEAGAGAYTAFAMKDRVAEETREAVGLWLAAGYLAWLAVRSRPPRGRHAESTA
jgi:hypothetical protein